MNRRKSLKYGISILTVPQVLSIITLPKITPDCFGEFFKTQGKFMEKIRLKLKAYDHRVLDRSVVSIVEAVKRTGSEIRGPVPLPTKKRRYTVLRSPHVNKDSREQFEIRVHSRIIDIVSATSETVDSLMKLDLAPEVDVEVRSMGK